MNDISKLSNLIKQHQPRKRIPNDSTCEVCGCDSSEIKLRRFNQYIVCTKHYNQLEKYGKIIDSSPVQHKKELARCCICGSRIHGYKDNKPYCQKHYLQLSRHGKIITQTIYNKNEFINHGDYSECILYNSKGEKVGKTKIDNEQIKNINCFKIYLRKHGSKYYAAINDKNGRKILLHRYLMNLTNIEYNINEVVDHINGDSLDNRLSNLRICSHKQNMMNIRKRGKIVGVSLNKNYNGLNKSKWIARIMHNYQTILLGYFETKEEAILARITKEKELFGDYGPNNELFFILNQPSPIDKLKEVLSDGV